MTGFEISKLPEELFEVICKKVSLQPLFTLCKSKSTYKIVKERLLKIKDDLNLEKYAKEGLLYECSFLLSLDLHEYNFDICIQHGAEGGHLDFVKNICWIKMKKSAVKYELEKQRKERLNFLENHFERSFIIDKYSFQRINKYTPNMESDECNFCRQGYLRETNPEKTCQLCSNSACGDCFREVICCNICKRTSCMKCTEYWSYSECGNCGFFCPNCVDEDDEMCECGGTLYPLE